LKTRRRSRRTALPFLLVGGVLIWALALVGAIAGWPKDTVNALVGFPVLVLLVYLAARLVIWLLSTWLHDVGETIAAGQRKHETTGQIAVDAAKKTGFDIVKLGLATALTSLDLAAGAGGGGGGGGSSGGGGSFGGGGASGSW
jgi:uncharacterized membrane protein YgcG